MSGDKISYEVPFLSPTGVAFMADNSRLRTLRSHLEKKFPNFKFAGFDTQPMKGQPIRISIVRMTGTLPKEEGVRLIRPEVERFVVQWIRETNERHRANRR